MNYEFRHRYVFVAQLGRGGMGAVFQAYDRQSPATPWVAIKVAQLPGGPQYQQMLKELFAREARAASLVSENTAYFVGLRGVDYNDPAYIALEYVPWPTLKAYRQRVGTLPPVHVAQIGVKILQGLHCMEYRRIVHRDLKPENLFVRYQEDDTFDVKIADLGIWSNSGEPDTLLKVPDLLRGAGTLAYMSPEQLREEPVTTASDLHMLGSVLWELSTGKVPWPTVKGPREKIVQDRLERVTSVPPRPSNMPLELYEILALALAFEAERRTFSQERASIPSDVHIARSMERALQRFADEYPEKRKHALAKAFESLDGAVKRLVELDAHLRRFESLSARKDSLRAKIERLRNEATEPDVLGDGVHALVGEIEQFASDANSTLFEDARRGESESARAEEAARRAAETEKTVEELRGELEDQRNQAERHKRRQLMLALPIATVTGLLLGFLVARGTGQPAISMPGPPVTPMPPTAEPPPPPANSTADPPPPVSPPLTTTTAPEGDSSSGSTTPAMDAAPSPPPPPPTSGPDRGWRLPAMDAAPSPPPPRPPLPPKTTSHPKPELLPPGANCSLHNECASGRCVSGTVPKRCE